MAEKKPQPYRLPESYLTKRQRRRLAAVQGAREALVGTPGEVDCRDLTLVASGSEVAPFDLVYVAAYIENGYVADGLEDPSLGDVLKAADVQPDLMAGVQSVEG